MVGFNVISGLKKKRITFVYNKQFCKLDLFDDGLMLLEIGVSPGMKDVSIPDSFIVLRDVTDDDEYKNINVGFISNLKIRKRKL